MVMPRGMTREQLDAFLAEPRNAMVAGIRRDGRPQVTPNFFLWDGERFYVSTTKRRLKYRIFRRDPRVQLVIDESPGFRTVMVDGTVDIWEDIERGFPYFLKLREKYRGAKQDEAALREELIRDQRVLLVITPDKPPEAWTSWTR
jgi:PPOX class probable F420-dependent enzyme